MKLYHYTNPEAKEHIEEYVVFVDDEEAMDSEEWGATGFKLYEECEIPEGILLGGFPTNRALWSQD